MNWGGILTIAVVVVTLVVVKRLTQISAHKAKKLIAAGALIVDVRDAGEYTAGHLKEALPMPLDQIETLAKRRIPSKDTVLLLHCQSGVRSGIARKKFRSLGYTHVYNLGSIARAGRILEEM